MKRNILIVLLLFAAYTGAYAQEQSSLSDAASTQYRLWFSIGRFLFREPHLGLEWQSKPEISHEIRAGFLYPQPLMKQLYEYFLTMSIHRHRGPSLGYHLRWWPKNEKHFMQFSATYRSLWFNNQEIWLGGASGSSFESHLELSQQRQDLLFQFAWGTALGKKRAYFETGAGMMLTYTTSQVYSCTHCNPNDPDIASILESHRNELKPTDGLSVSPWLHFSFSIPICLN